MAQAVVPEKAALARKGPIFRTFCNAVLEERSPEDGASAQAIRIYMYDISKNKLKDLFTDRKKYQKTVTIGRNQ